jgi:hypothetical protein
MPSMLSKPDGATTDPASHPSGLDMQRMSKLLIDRVVHTILLVLPGQEFPVELARAPEQAVLETADFVHLTVGRHASGVRHARGEDAAAEARVQDGHGAHEARLVGEVDVEINAEVAARGDIIVLVVLSLDVGERAVAEERAVEQRGVGTGGAEALLGDHGYGAVDGMRHDVARARVRLCGASCGAPAAVAGDSDDFGRFLGLVDDYHADVLAKALVGYLHPGLACQRHPVAGLLRNLGGIALHKAGVRAVGVGILVRNGPVLLAPVGGLLGGYRR